jgi:hypothetical protein
MSDSLSDLPDDVAAAIQPHLPAPPTVLAAIGVQIAQKREEAKGARAMSGIEATWKDCEEAYLGIDDANRSEFDGARWAKPMSMDGPVTTGRKSKQTDYRSTVYLRLTSRYVDAGVAKLGEILLPADDKAFSFSEMPVPELLAAKDDDSQVVHSGLGMPLTRPPGKGEAAPPAPAAAAPPAPGAPPSLAQSAVPPSLAQSALQATAPGASPAPVDAAAAPAVPAPAGPPRVPLTVKDFAIEKIEMARKRAQAADTHLRLDDRDAVSRRNPQGHRGRGPHRRRRAEGAHAEGKAGHGGDRSQGRRRRPPDQGEDHPGRALGRSIRGTSFRTRRAARTSTTAISCLSGIICRRDRCAA